MAVLEDIEAAITALANERDAAITEFKQKLNELKKQREVTLAEQKLASFTETEREALKNALNKPPEQVIQANGVDTNTQVGEIGTTI